MSDSKSLCLDLLHADTEEDVIGILKKARYWDDPKYWRLYGDKEGNFAQAGNQQSLPEAALVEKIVNSCDARLLSECLLKGINPESDQAPASVRDAVAIFFEGKTAAENAGILARWPSAKRKDEAKAITVAATGGRPTRGHKSTKMCLTIADQGEGQSPNLLPKTILSLNAKNKQRIRFVQGKFNMGGTGALRFCGSNGLQLVISKRHPKLLRSGDSGEWGFTVVRREQPSNKSGDPVHSEFTYLAPIDADNSPRAGEVLRFASAHLPLMPDSNTAYSRPTEWGTVVKLYEYDTSVGQSNVLMKDGLLYALERLLPQISLPVRVHECRAGFKGDEKRSFETTLAGLVVRLEEGKGDNLEERFPLSVTLHAAGMEMTARIYAFKEGRASTYLADEGVIFAINGQAHGNLPKSLFSRPRAVGLPRLRDSLLVLVDCSQLTAVQREDLFMSSRDRLSKKPIRYEVEHEIEELLHANPDLRRLQQERREHDVETKLSEERPLEEVLGRVLKASPTLKNLFLHGRRLSRPFAAGNNGKGDAGGSDKGDHEFIGRRHPTFFRVPDVADGKTFVRHCEAGRRCRVKFETDVENGYFDRASDRGAFQLEIIEGSQEFAAPDYSLTLDDGAAHLNLKLPESAAATDYMLLQASVSDPFVESPFVSLVRLVVVPYEDHPSTGSKKKYKKEHDGTSGDKETPQGIALPKVIPVRENDEYWKKYKFDPDVGCHVVSDPVMENGRELLDHVFYINIDNASLKTEMKYSKQDARLLEAKFKYANVLLGVAMLHEDEKRGKVKATTTSRSDDENEDTNETPGGAVLDRIRRVSAAIAPVLIPMIDQLSGLDEEDLQELSSAGEDA